MKFKLTDQAKKPSKEIKSVPKVITFNKFANLNQRGQLAVKASTNIKNKTISQKYYKDVKSQLQSNNQSVLVLKWIFIHLIAFTMQHYFQIGTKFILIVAFAQITMDLLSIRLSNIKRDYNITIKVNALNYT
jgi:16S rRNA U1498 N3-methylase RsmE